MPGRRQLHHSSSVTTRRRLAARGSLRRGRALPRGERLGARSPQRWRARRPYARGSRRYALSYEAAGEQLLQRRTIASPTARRPLCLTGVLTLRSGTRVSYRRYGTDPLSIVLERTDDQPAATFEQASGNIPAALAKTSWIRLDASPDDSDDDSKSKGIKSSAHCSGDAATRLPIYGQVRIGTPMRPESRGAEPSSGLLSVMIEMG